ncbi:peptidoglycan-binding protein [Kribbella sp. NPDC051587]|uniref:peptidoglycan-binding protein n=1 Tax=Kribbella sp. NPDC051587 TaxID=3364119 RepID=UPI00379B3AAE
MDREREDKSAEARPAPVRRPPAEQSAPAGMGDFQMLQNKAGNAALVEAIGEQAGTPGNRPNLDLGDRGPGVRVLQQKLRSIKDIDCPVDGVFGQSTHDAVVQFQTRHPELHPATGGVGAGTWAALDRETGQLAEQDLHPPSTVNPVGVTTSGDPLVQLETYVLADLLGGKLPWYVWNPLRKVVRLLYTAGTSTFLVEKLIYDAVHFVESGRWEAEKAKGHSPLAELLFSSHLTDTLLFTDVVAEMLSEEIALFALYKLSGLRHAEPTFKHYLHGGGADYFYRMQEFVDQDAGFRAMVAAATPLDGSTQVTSYETSDADSKDWNYTFGGIDYVSLKLIDGSDRTRAKVRIVLADPYQWHPDELRASIYLHKAMEILKQTGAREFMQRDDGSPVVVDLSRR